jgi:hypothetical protein
MAARVKPAPVLILCVNLDSLPWLRTEVAPA